MAKRSSGELPSQRQLRVGEQMRHLLADWLVRGEIHDPRLDGVSVTVSEVRVSPDLREAKAFVSELGRSLSAEVAAALRAAAPQLAGRLARAMHLKYAPRLRFVADTSFEEADRIERLLKAERARLKAEEGGETA